MNPFGVFLKQRTLEPAALAIGANRIPITTSVNIFNCRSLAPKAGKSFEKNMSSDDGGERNTARGR